MKIAKTISYVFVAIILVGVLAMLVMFLNNGQSNYCVGYGDTVISRKSTDIEMPKNAYSVFYTKSVMSVDKFVSANDYEINIYLDKDNVSDVGYTVDGIKYGLHGEIDFMQAFNVCKQDGFFAIYLPSNYSLMKILQACYPNKTIVIDEDITLWEKDCFQIVVTFLTENKTVTISFH